MKNNRILALSIITLLGSAHGVANAGITLSAAGSSNPVKFAKELPASTQSLAFATASDGYVVNIAPTGVKVSPTNNVYVKFYLLNGAKFKSDLTDANKSLVCRSSNAVAGTIAGITGTKTVGGGGQAFATFQLKPNNAAGTATLGSACQLKIPDLTLTSGLKDVSISATVEYNDAGAPKVMASKGQFITFVQGLSVSYTPNANPFKIDVGQSSKKFIDGTTNKNTAMVGTITYAAGSVYKADGNLIAPADALSTVKLTITGPAVGSVHSGNGGASVGTSGVFMSRAGATCGKTPGTVVTTPGIVSYSGTSVTFNGLAVSALAAGIDICIQNNGTNVIADGQITANLSVLSPANSMVPDLTAARSALATLKKNGTATKALVLPDPGQTDKPYVRIYNIGSSTGRVLGTLYGVDGKAIASGVLSAALAPNATIVLGAPDIAKALGIAGWTGRPWLQIEAEFQGLRAQALIRSSTGVLTEFSDAACGTSALCGDAQ